MVEAVIQVFFTFERYPCITSYTFIVSSIQTLCISRSALSDEKRRLDSRISELEEELEEERAQNEMLEEKAKRAQLSVGRISRSENTACYHNGQSLLLFLKGSLIITTIFLSFQADQSHNELSTERSNSQRLENQRTSLERQVKCVLIIIFVSSSFFVLVSS